MSGSIDEETLASIEFEGKNFENMVYVNDTNDLLIYTSTDLYCMNLVEAWDAVQSELYDQEVQQRLKKLTGISKTDETGTSKTDDKIKNVSYNIDKIYRILIQTSKELKIINIIDRGTWSETWNMSESICDDEELKSENIIVFNPYVNDMIISAGKEIHGGYSEISIWKLKVKQKGYQFTKKHVFEKLNCKRNWMLRNICDGFVTRFKISPKGDKIAVVVSARFGSRPRNNFSNLI